MNDNLDHISEEVKQRKTRHIIGCIGSFKCHLLLIQKLIEVFEDFVH